MGQGAGYGKTILFNEHFVVYNVPSIVSAIDKTTIAHVQKMEGSGWVLDDSRLATPAYKEEKLEQEAS